MSSNDGLQSWYANKNIFITGGTGFLGVTLLEKILRSVPNGGEVYLLLREKKGKDISERLEEIKKNTVFEKLIADNTKTEDEKNKYMDSLFSKVKAIAGDVGQENLGISESDRAMLIEKINVIFHSAATLDFADTLKQTVDINLLGTRRVVELGKQCKNLKAFIHVSSAYVNSYKLETEEIIYPLFKPAEEIIDLVKKTPEEELIKMTPEILGDHPNTYTFTKHMAEHEVQNAEEVFPCTIVRPSMIVGCWKEPTPGWSISKNGPQGFLMGAAKGVIRRLPCAINAIYDYIPVDIVVNQLLVAGFHAGVNNVKKVEVYHCTSSTRKPFRWADVQDSIYFYLHKYPLKSAVWYPHLSFVSNLTLYKISAFFVHIIPAILLDFVTKLSGGRPVLMKLHRNVNSSLKRLDKFIFTEWTYHADRSQALHKWLSPNDQETFNLDISNIDWNLYFEDLTKGARIYLNKERMTNIEAARRKDTILLFLHITLQTLIMSLLWYIFASAFGLTMLESVYSVPIFYFLYCLL